MQEVEIVWEEPPERSALNPVAEVLRANPGQWARIGVETKERSATMTATNIRRGRPVAFLPAGSFEATSRKIADGEYRIYARYVGEVES